MATILLVEDDEFVRDMLSQLLKREKHTVFTAEDGEYAVNILKKEQPDIMITDLIMPRKSGLTLISEVKDKHPKMEIIAISGGGRLDPTDYLDISEHLGAAASFEKPVEKDCLLMTIDLLLSKHKKSKS